MTRKRAMAPRRLPAPAFSLIVKLKPVRSLAGSGGMPLGIMEDAAHESATIRLQAGDQLLIVTDVVTEAADASDAQFGEARVEAFLSTVAPGDSQALTRLVEAVRTFEAGRPAFDDVAAIFMELAAAPSG